MNTSPAISCRPIVRLPAHLMAWYDGCEEQDSRLRLHTSRHHKDLVGMWLFGHGLHCNAFRPGRTYDVGDDADDEISKQSLAVRLQLLGLSVRSSKAALDLVLAGNYSESFMLVRSMLEGWARTVYVRLRPAEYKRWYDPDPEVPVMERKKEPTLGEIEGVVSSSGSTHDRQLFDEATLRFRLLNLGAHPSGEGITQVRDDERGIFLLGPDYREDFARHAFNHGIFSQLALLNEIALLDPQPDEWTAGAVALHRQWEPAHRSIGPVLEKVAEDFEMERAAKQSLRTDERRLRDIFRALGADGRASLLDHAEKLASSRP